MTKKDKILSELKRVAANLFGSGNGQAYLYGSQARGDASKNSDWDIIIITDDNACESDTFERFAFPFAELGWKLGAEIIPIHFTRSQWEAQRNTGFYNNVITDLKQL